MKKQSSKREVETLCADCEKLGWEKKVNDLGGVQYVSPMVKILNSWVIISIFGRRILVCYTYGGGKIVKESGMRNARYQVNSISEDLAKFGVTGQ